ncbi:tetratricopeptide repeat protein [Floridanema aerugineum]|uniref:Tetratricopeptide repeat protein n=1 Tax=Floridaenema aerugineum BLCC-F46 TaxID=3153654 RepID=A0ABV4X4P0_9CYAN
MNRQSELEKQNQKTLDNFRITPSGESILVQLGINPTAIKTIKPPWKRNKYRTVVNWLMKYQPLFDVTNLKKVKSLVEAFYHLCEVEAWKEAGCLLSVILNTPTNEKLHNQLQTWGYYREQIDLYSQVLRKLNSEWDATCLGGLGNAHQFLGDYTRAIEFHQECLAIAREKGYRKGEGNALGNLGNAYSSLGDYTRAMNLYQQDLVIAREIGNRRGEGNLAILHDKLGDRNLDLEYCNFALSIATELEIPIQKACIKLKQQLESSEKYFAKQLLIWL